MDPAPSDGSDLLPGERSEVVQHLTSLLTPEAKPTGIILIGLDPIADSASGAADPGLVGEDMMQQITDSVGRSVEPTDLVSRFGLDQVAIIRPEVTAPAEADGLAYLLFESLTESATPIEARALAPSIGVATSMKGDSAADLVRYAEHALEQAQILGGTRVIAFDDVDRELLAPPGGHASAGAS